MTAHTIIEADVEVRCPTVAEIRAEVARFYGVTELDLLSARRTRDIARPRQVAMFLCRHLTKHSLPSIGRFLGGRDHSTVIHALESVEDMMKTDSNFKATVDDLGKKLKMRVS